RLRFVFDPIPTPVIGVDPVSRRVGLPFARPVPGNPDVAPARVALPAAMRFQRCLELNGYGDLRLRRIDRNATNWHERQKCNRNGARQMAESDAKCCQSEHDRFPIMVKDVLWWQRWWASARSAEPHRTRDNFRVKT